MIKKVCYKMWDYTVITSGLTKREAMITEQLLISTYTLEYLTNARREIAVKNLEGYRENMDACIELFVSSNVDELMDLARR